MDERMPILLLFLNRLIENSDLTHKFLQNTEIMSESESVVSVEETILPGEWYLPYASSKD